jgi:hypothetical protein
MKTTYEGTNVTLYTRGDTSFMSLGNIMKTECRSLKIEVGPYAQYTNAIQVTFVPKGGRRARTMVQTHAPDVLVLEGHGHMDPDGAFVPSGIPSGPGVTVTQGRYRSNDPRWGQDFSARVSTYVLQRRPKIAADYRSHAVTEKSYG